MGYHVSRRAVVLAVGAFVAVLAPATESHASGFSYAFATPPQVSVPGTFASAITALASEDGTMTIDVTALAGTTITATADPACALTSTGEHCATTASADKALSLAFTGTYTSAVIDLQLSAADVAGPVTFAANTLYPAPRALTPYSPIPLPPAPSPPVPPVFPTSLKSSGATAAPSAQAARLRHRRARVIMLTNKQRAGLGLGSLQTDADLTRSAQNYVDHLAADGAFSHTDGSVLAERVVRAGYRYRFVGENLAMGQASAGTAVTAWMQSPDHRANMLDPRFTQMGVGVAKRADGRLIWCIDFGWPAPTS